MRWFLRFGGSELEKLREWMATRKEMYSGAIGGRYSYTFCHTSIGTVIKVKDDGTGKNDLSPFTS